MVNLLGYTVIDAKGYEADDVIATLATMARNAGENAIVVTGDRDVFQLVEDPFIQVLYNKKGVSDYVLYNEEGIFERTGVTPEKYVDYAWRYEETIQTICQACQEWEKKQQRN